VTIPDAGHIPMWDDPPAVAEILLTGSGGTRIGTAVRAAS